MSISSTSQQRTEDRDDPRELLRARRFDRYWSQYGDRPFRVHAHLAALLLPLQHTGLPFCDNATLARWTGKTYDSIRAYTSTYADPRRGFSRARHLWPADNAGTRGVIHPKLRKTLQDKHDRKWLLLFCVVFQTPDWHYQVRRQCNWILWHVMHLVSGTSPSLRKHRALAPLALDEVDCEILMRMTEDPLEDIGVLQKVWQTLFNAPQVAGFDSQYRVYLEHRLVHPIQPFHRKRPTPLNSRLTVSPPVRDGAPVMSAAMIAVHHVIISGGPLSEAANSAHLLSSHRNGKELGESFAVVAGRLQREYSADAIQDPRFFRVLAVLETALGRMLATLASNTTTVGFSDSCASVRKKIRSREWGNLQHCLDRDAVEAPNLQRIFAFAIRGCHDLLGSAPPEPGPDQ